jgi:hypothetical protein
MEGDITLKNNPTESNQLSTVVEVKGMFKRPHVEGDNENVIAEDDYEQPLNTEYRCNLF